MSRVYRDAIDQLLRLIFYTERVMVKARTKELRAMRRQGRTEQSHEFIGYIAEERSFIDGCYLDMKRLAAYADDEKLYRRVEDVVVKAVLSKLTDNELR